MVIDAEDSLLCKPWTVFETCSESELVFDSRNSNPMSFEERAQKEHAKAAFTGGFLVFLAARPCALYVSVSAHLGGFALRR